MQTVTASKLSPQQILANKVEYPILINRAVANWPALNSWSAERLKQLGGHIPVRLVSGNRENGKYQYHKTCFARFIDNHQRQSYYLKEFNLLKHMPDLKKDINMTNFQSPLSSLYTYAWLGCAGSQTGMHYDVFDNFLCHISGKKTVYLLDKNTPNIPHSNRFDPYARIGLLDLSQPKTINNSDIKKRIVRIDLQPGDCLYIPKGCWHQVSNQSFCISVASFNIKLRDTYIVLQEATKKILHNIGLYKSKHNCTCHT